jgi:hypothetical protein
MPVAVEENFLVRIPFGKILLTNHRMFLEEMVPIEFCWPMFPQSSELQPEIQKQQQKHVSSTLHEVLDEESWSRRAGKKTRQWQWQPGLMPTVVIHFVDQNHHHITSHNKMQLSSTDLIFLGNTCFSAMKNKRQDLVDNFR